LVLRRQPYSPGIQTNVKWAMKPLKVANAGEK
jgi:hypothetical protein